MAKKVNSWEEEDAKRGREQLKKGHKGHAEALFNDAHDSYNWKGGDYGHEKSPFHKEGSFMSKHNASYLHKERLLDDMPIDDKGSALHKEGWIQEATASIKKRGTEGVCTGDKFGSSSCPPGSKRYTLAKTFKKIAKKRKT